MNDAPALKQADVGIAVENATDIAKAAASLVLTRPGLGEVIMAIDGSRRIYQRMKTFVLTMNTRKISIPLFLSLGVLVFGAFALNPLLMILLMLFADVATMTVSLDQATPSPGPDRWDVRPLMLTALVLATLLLLMSAAVFWAAMSAVLSCSCVGSPFRLVGFFASTIVVITISCAATGNWSINCARDNRRSSRIQ